MIEMISAFQICGLRLQKSEDFGMKRKAVLIPKSASHSYSVSCSYFAGYPFKYLKNSVSVEKINMLSSSRVPLYISRVFTKE